MNRSLVSGLRRVATSVAFFAVLVYLWHSIVQRGIWNSILWLR